ncbi:MAG: glycosyltransferase [Luminiphilus sp.]|nr:glycosyltransferase [Luminiphilus sp.]
MSLDKAARLLGAHLPLYLVDQSQSAAYSQAVQAMLREVPSDSLLQLHYIARVTNDGYGAGHNTVLDSVLGHYHLILNPDVELPESTLVQVTDNLRDHPEIVIMAPRAANEMGDEEHLAKRYPSVLVLFLRALGFAPLKRCFFSGIGAVRAARFTRRGRFAGRAAVVRLLHDRAIRCPASCRWFQ